MSGLIQLGPYYNRNVRMTREAVLAKRNAGARTMVVYLTAPITAPVIEVAIDTASLYVLGLRKLNAPVWWAFEPDGKLPPVPGPSRPIALGGPASYDNLGLHAGAKHTIAPWKLLNDLSVFDGGSLDPVGRKNLLLVVFLISEAMRFGAVQALCYRYVDNAERYFQAPDHYYANPGDLTDHSIVYSSEIVDKVKSWRQLSERHDFDVLLPWAGPA